MNDRSPAAGSSPITPRPEGGGARRSAPPELTRQVHRGTAAYELVFSPVLLAVLGLLLDQKVFGTTPWITVAFAVVGVTGAVVKLVYQYRLDFANVVADAPYLPSSTRGNVS